MSIDLALVYVFKRMTGEYIRDHPLEEMPGGMTYREVIAVYSGTWEDGLGQYCTDVIEKMGADAQVEVAYVERSIISYTRYTPFIYPVYTFITIFTPMYTIYIYTPNTPV